MHLSVLITHDFSEHIFIKIYNFLLGGGVGSVGKNIPFFPLSSLRCVLTSGLSSSKEEGKGNALEQY